VIGFAEIATARAGKPAAGVGPQGTKAQVHATLADTATKMADHIKLTFSASEALARGALGAREREPSSAKPSRHGASGCGAYRASTTAAPDDTPSGQISERIHP
jgi:hypothetical protein